MFNIDTTGIKKLEDFYKNLSKKTQHLNDSIPKIKEGLESKLNVKLIENTFGVIPISIPNKIRKTTQRKLPQPKKISTLQTTNKIRAKKIPKNVITKDISKELFKWFANKT